MPQILVFLMTTGAVNYIYGYFAVGVGILFFYQAIKSRRLWLNGVTQRDFWWLFAFAISYAAIGYGGSVQSILYYVAVPVVSYLAGWIIVEANWENKEKTIHSIIVAAMFGCCVHAALNYVSNIGKERWMLTDFFTGELRAATGSGSINTIAFSLAFHFVQIEKSLKMKIAGLSCFAVSFLYAMLLGTRTQFIILIITMFFILLIYMSEHRGTKENAKMLRRVFLLAVIICLAYSMNLMGIQEYYQKSNLNARFVHTEDTARTDDYRFVSVFDGMTSLFENPLGGLHSKGYFHNMWLDVGRIGGIIPTLFIVAFTMESIRAARCFFLSDAQQTARYMIAALMCGFMLNFFVEPILEGLFDSFYLFCIIHGMLKSYLYYADKESRLYPG